MEEIAAWVGRITWSCGTFLLTHLCLLIKL